MSPHFLIRLHKKRDATLATLGKERNPTPKFESLFGKDHQIKRNTEKTEKRGIAPKPPYTDPDPKLLHSTLGKGRNRTWKRTQQLLWQKFCQKNQKLKVCLGRITSLKETDTPEIERNPEKERNPEWHQHTPSI